MLGDLTMYYAGRPVQLTYIECRLLLELSVDTGRVLTHGQLLRRVWGPREASRPALPPHSLTRAPPQAGEDASNPTYIFAEPRVGYRMAKGEG